MDATATGHADDIRLVDVDPGDDRLADVFAVLSELRPHLTLDGFRSVYERGHAQGLRFLAAYVGDRCVGVAGWRVVDSTFAVRKLYVDDLVTTASSRSAGIGRALLAELEQRGRASGCRMLDLDSGVQRADAHRFYFREGMTITSFHFAKPLDR